MAPIGRTRILLNLAFTRFPKVPHFTLAGFDPAVLLDAGIGSVAFIRHGNTAPAPEGGVDFDRRLTDLGRDQSRSAGSSYGRTLRPFHPVALCSPAPRCIETAQIFLEASRKSDDGFIPGITSAVDLYDGTMQPEGSRLFRKIGYAPLRSYLEDPDEEDRTTAHDVLGSYAVSALDAMAEVGVASTTAQSSWRSTPKNMQQKQQQRRTTLLFFAHAVYLPAAALGLASACGCSGEESRGVILDTNTMEAEGYLVDIAGSRTSLLCRPEGKQ